MDRLSGFYKFRKNYLELNPRYILGKPKKSYGQKKNKVFKKLKILLDIFFILQEDFSLIRIYTMHRTVSSKHTFSTFHKNDFKNLENISSKAKTDFSNKQCTRLSSEETSFDVYSQM